MTKAVQFSDADGPQETVQGLLDIRDRLAYLRPEQYLPGRADPRVPLSQVRQYGLRAGDHVVAKARKPFDRLETIVTVNGTKEWRDRPHFADLTPIHPSDRIRLETESPTTRVIDLFAPVGKGQRGLIVAPPKAGKTLALKAIAEGITRNHPECALLVVLVGERPEEVTELRESIKGEVAAPRPHSTDRTRTMSRSPSSPSNGPSASSSRARTSWSCSTR